MFKILKQSKISNARLGVLKTLHGDIKTPFFMPDATRGVVKCVEGSGVLKAGVKAMVVNTLHLYLQPGMKVIKKAKGIHSFMNWPGPLLSDSGGFQVFSLLHNNPKMGKITDEGAIFKSPIDGSAHILTPERSIQIQFDLEVDMMVCLDDCPPNDSDNKKLSIAVKRTIAWAGRCKEEFEKQIKKRKIKEDKRPKLFGVIQGGMNKDLRRLCAEALVDIGFDGYGFGARPVDEKGNFLSEILKYTAELIPKDSLRFALGIGTPNDIVKCAGLGWDMFDCVIPTREARHGRLFQNLSPQPPLLNRRGGEKSFYTTININNAKFTHNKSSINKNSKLLELREYSLSYLHHLFKISEPLGWRLATLNNLEFYSGLMQNIRQGINKLR
ncbi:tRNA guanosine(34) transglycosylase Tgt [Candidatus Parcubacteria bacterium]|nr:tRNA guanosine(34) transglycosylase Tgt [Candidatus Parcubacteria bacterium]